jgi:predicted acyltransferase
MPVTQDTSRAPASAGTPGAGAEVSDLSTSRRRIASIDALRGLVMFLMIFVNDIAGVSDAIVPAWMKHFHGKSGMTFVDLVFPGFLFIVGMSIPPAIGARLERGEPLWKTLLHLAGRTLSLLMIGILMVNGTPDSEKMGWSGPLWCSLMYLSAILGFCTISSFPKASVLSPQTRALKKISVIVRVIGLLGLAWLAFAFRGQDGHHIVSLSPFQLHTEWYGILGLIGWAYLAGAIVFLVFRGSLLALLGCLVLLMCLYPADHTGAFEHFWLAKYVGIGEMLGSHAAITVAGILLAVLLAAPEQCSVRSRTRFTLLFIGGFAAAAWLLDGLYGINKNKATPSWCLWACAFTAALWLFLSYVTDGKRVALVARPLVVAGQNVLLAYLLSEMLPSVIDLLRLTDWYGKLAEPDLLHAVVRSAACGVIILCATAGLNRIGFRLRL